MSQSRNYQEFLNLFPDYSELASNEFHQHLTVESRCKGGFLCIAGAALPSLLFLLEGRARVFLPLFDGREYLFRVYQRGDLIGDLEFFLERPATCSVQCTVDTRLCTFPVEIIRTESSRLAGPILALGRGVAEKLRENSVSEAVSNGYPAASRLAAYFLRTREPDLRARNLQELSDWLGISYRHLTRTLRKLVALGGLKKQNRAYEVDDRRTLAAIANEVMQEEPLRL